MNSQRCGRMRNKMDREDGHRSGILTGRQSWFQVQDRNRQAACSGSDFALTISLLATGRARISPPTSIPLASLALSDRSSGPLHKLTGRAHESSRTITVDFGTRLA